MEDLSIPNELDRWIRQRGRDLRLRQADRQPAVKLVNHLRDDLVTFLKENDEQPFFRDITVLNSGSYYEYVKVNKQTKNHWPCSHRTVFSTSLITSLLLYSV